MKFFAKNWGLAKKTRYMQINKYREYNQVQKNLSSQIPKLFSYNGT